jgi:phage shock protein E
MRGKFLFAGLVGMMVMLGCANSSDKPKEPAKQTLPLRQGVEVGEFEKLLKEPGVVLVDVRDATEFDDGHIAGAINIDVKSAGFSSQINKLDKSKHYLMYCVAGVRAQKACVIMDQQGFKNYDWLTTGISGWKTQGKPVTKGL